MVSVGKEGKEEVGVVVLADEAGREVVFRERFVLEELEWRVVVVVSREGAVLE